MKESKKKLLGAALAFGAGFLLPVLSAAQQSQIGEVTLFGEEEFKIQAATKTEVPLSKAPGSVTVISAAQIRESGARTIPELLRQVAGVNVRWNPMVQTIDMRSFGQNPFTSRVLLLIDGVPYNSWNKGGFPQHPGLDFFILQNIKRLEILRGPGSSLYGENAYWGVINIVTLSGEDLEGGKVVASGGDLDSETLGGIFGKKTKNGSFLVSGQALQGQIPVLFWSEEADSQVSGVDLFFKGVYKDFELSYYRHDDEVDGFDQPGFRPGSRFRSAKTIRQTVDILAAKYKHQWSQGLSFAADVSYAQRDGSRCAACHAAPQDPAFEGTVDHGYQLIGDFRLGFARGNHDILLGVEARQVDTGDHTDELSAGSTGSEVIVSYNKAATYFQDQISLHDDRLRLVLGARYDGANELFDSEISPRIAAVYNPNEKLVLRGGYSTAFRFPNFSELYQSSNFLTLDGGGFPITIQVFRPNPELEPEKITTYDFGVEYRFSPVVSAKVDLFQSEVKDFIVLSFIAGEGPSSVGFENHPDKAEIYGSELEVRWRPRPRFTTFINWTWQQTDAKGNGVAGDGRPLEAVYAPENKVNLGAFFGPFKGFRAALEAQWRDEYLGPSAWNFADRTSTVVLDDYLYVNVRLSWDAPVRIGNASEGLRFSLYGQNLLDEQPQETFLPIDMRMPGTTFYGGVELRF